MARVRARLRARVRARRERERKASFFPFLCLHSESSLAKECKAFKVKKDNDIVAFTAILGWSPSEIIINFCSFFFYQIFTSPASPSSVGSMKIDIVTGMHIG